MSAAQKTYRSCTLPCPCCGEPEANIALRLGDIDGDEAFVCQSCDTSFSVALVESILTRWPRMLEWIAAIPADLPADLDETEEL